MGDDGRSSRTGPCSRTKPTSTDNGSGPRAATPSTSKVHPLPPADPDRSVRLTRGSADPATGETIGSCPDMDTSDLSTAVAAAKEAFATFKSTTAKERHDLLMAYFRLINQHSADIASLIVLENGKSMTDAKGEAAYAASFFEWFAEEAVRIYGDVIPSAVPGQRNVVIKQPVGVCGILCPWVGVFRRC